MKITIVTVGKIKEKYFTDAIAEYTGIINPITPKIIKNIPIRIKMYFFIIAFIILPLPFSCIYITII